MDHQKELTKITDRWWPDSVVDGVPVWLLDAAVQCMMADDQYPEGKTPKDVAEALHEIYMATAMENIND